jgi:hypothetical protein
MRNAFALSVVVGVLVSVAAVPRRAAADPVVITGGSLAVFTQIDLPAFTLCTSHDCSSAGTVFQGVLAANAGQSFNVGDVVNPIGAGGPINAAGPVNEIINGLAFQAFLSGSFEVTAAPFVAPPQNGQSQFSFTTPFTMQGQINASADPMGRVPLFSVQVTGSGVETISGRTFSGGAPADYFAQSFVAAFDAPAATPEPATGLLLAAALVGWLLRSRRARARATP